MFVSCFLCDEQVVISATGQSLAQRSLTGCVSVIVCDLETSTMRRPGPKLGCCVAEENSSKMFNGLKT